MPQAHVNGVDIEYVTQGDPANPALLLVMGLGAQLTAWPQGFVDLLVGQGFHVITYDNRDVGLSTKFEGLPDLAGLLAGTGEAPYTIEDMADDGVALLDHLDVERAHVVGASMGGMITQAMVINHPDRFLSACSVMSTTGDGINGMPTGEAMSALLQPPATTREEAIARSVAASRIIGSPGYPAPEEELVERAGATFDRSFCPEGAARQLAAILTAADRTEGLHGVQIPFLVIHGEADPLVQPSGGEATVAAVPGARLVTFPGMGHDLPEALFGPVVEAIVATTVLAAA